MEQHRGPRVESRAKRIREVQPLRQLERLFGPVESLVVATRRFEHEPEAPGYVGKVRTWAAAAQAGLGGDQQFQGLVEIPRSSSAVARLAWHFAARPSSPALFARSMPRLEALGGPGLVGPVDVQNPQLEPKLRRQSRFRSISRGRRARTDRNWLPRCLRTPLPRGHRRARGSPPPVRLRPPGRSGDLALPPHLQTGQR